jgi:NAD(P)-dependent dehydrogenase (short-subunit alcohol dehydrogenase family)/predicted metal-dependent enzyme (double-stranded beta helix superfamily)
MKSALVTGAASGLGAAIARRLSREGYRVAIVDTDGAAARAQASELSGAVAFAADVTDEAAIEALLDAFGDIPDVLVNNAGIVRFGPILEHSVEDFRKVIDVNLTGTFIVTRAVARRMVTRGSGAIVNITSLNAVAPSPDAGAYPASKAAVALLTQHFALALGPHGIRVNAVAPGFIDAGMSAPIYEDSEVRATRGGAVPLGSARHRRRRRRRGCVPRVRPGALHHRSAAHGGRRRIVQPQESSAPQGAGARACQVMTSTAVRDCAQAIHGAIAEHGNESAAIAPAIRAALAALMKEHDLLERGIDRQANNVAFSRYLYYDGELSILIYEVPMGRTIPAHDHGIWETLSVYRGRLRHIVYARADDGRMPGVADLRVLEDVVLERGDFAIVAPPADIHSFTALDEGTYGITVVNGAYKAQRHYYDPAAGTYEIRAGRNVR